MSKRWKASPAGPEQLYLNNLFKSGAISQDAKPVDIKRQHQIFEKFSTSVFRQHFDKTRAKYGGNLPITTNDVSDDDGKGPSNIEEKENKFHTNNAINENKNCNTMDKSITYFNYPIMTSFFKDPANDGDRVLVTIILIPGVKNVKFEVLDDGKHAQFSYDWPEIAYDIHKLFKTELRKGEILDYHPKCAAYKNQLQSTRSSLSEAPRASIIIELPIIVQKEEHTISIQVEKDDNDGSKILKVVLKGFSSSYLVKKLSFINIE